jgi:hypothetical protein
MTTIQAIELYLTPSLLLVAALLITGDRYDHRQDR